MNGQQPSFEISQGMEITLPEKTRGFPVSYKEWESIRTSVSNIDDSNSFFHTIGSTLIGASLSTIITIFVTDFGPAKIQQYIIMWAIAIGCTICGSLSMIFAKMQKKLIKTTSSHVLSQLSIIEDRYPKPT